MLLGDPAAEERGPPRGGAGVISRLLCFFFGHDDILTGQRGVLESHGHYYLPGLSEVIYVCLRCERKRIRVEVRP